MQVRHERSQRQRTDYGAEWVGNDSQKNIKILWFDED